MDSGDHVSLDIDKFAESVEGRLKILRSFSDQCFHVQSSQTVTKVSLKDFIAAIAEAIAERETRLLAWDSWVPRQLKRVRHKPTIMVVWLELKVSLAAFAVLAADRFLENH
ncbi:hypothetical protein SADUNF_Sadunf01G0022000 [Salix dunnii]|uniref:Uncharacterized protein n=1 Tax=Salix dunnii TaxID=1413687 RepID=A0A835N9J8_9ROSI|nr:hypothetical protein SADUNF_Sadunf01G0022000 [Salix dunnii]